MILITGATGFIGAHLIKELYRRGYTLRCLVRDKSMVRHIRKQDVAMGDMRDFSSLLAATKNCNAVVHLAAPIGHNDYKTNYDVTVAGTKNLIEACKANGVKRIIFFSSVGVFITSNYGKTKLMAENLLRASGMQATILRGDWIYGEGDWGLAAVVRIMRRYPFLPVPGNGNYRKRPLYVKDAVAAIISCLKNKNTINKTYMLGGPMITYNEMVQLLRDSIGIRKKKIYIPVWILLAVAAPLGLLGRREISKNNIRGLTFYCRYGMSRTEKELKIKPVRFADGLEKCKDYYRKIFG